jgi:hypothetical protein
MKIVIKHIDELKPYEKNPRYNEGTVDMVVESIKKYGFNVPLVIDGNNTIVAGHTRYKALKKMQIDEVPCVVVDYLSEKEIRAFRIADNKIAEYSEWDMLTLTEEMADLQGLFTGFDWDDFMDQSEDENPYTGKVATPIYAITDVQPPIESLLNTAKADYLISEVEQSNVSEAEKAFLIQASRRHNVFDYRNIAEYYAHASKEMQALMERSALIIIDYETAIQSGYVSLSQSILDMIEEDSDEG